MFSGHLATTSRYLGTHSSIYFLLLAPSYASPCPLFSLTLPPLVISYLSALSAENFICCVVMSDAKVVILPSI